MMKRMHRFAHVRFVLSIANDLIDSSRALINALNICVVRDSSAHRTHLLHARTKVHLFMRQWKQAQATFCQQRSKRFSKLQQCQADLQTFELLVGAGDPLLVCCRQQFRVALTQWQATACVAAAITSADVTQWLSSIRAHVANASEWLAFEQSDDACPMEWKDMVEDAGAITEEDARLAAIDRDIAILKAAETKTRRLYTQRRRASSLPASPEPSPDCPVLMSTSEVEAAVDAALDMLTPEEAVLTGAVAIQRSTSCVEGGVHVARAAGKAAARRPRKRQRSVVVVYPRPNTPRMATRMATRSSGCGARRSKRLKLL